ncbi:MAG TPA: DCC1-like thiol-disulfide oxidoreductase family protein [Thermoanaerobaculia bacterium]|jgi:predicted DCC family thiol-disulfide oxidoreductase YuxK|nr:DCC1-like thiol-disulfide oxidoreductase family protein [Thermoanaerobaculia bacterium]
MSTQTLVAADRLPAAGTLTSPSANLVLYDGVCGLCNRLVRFLLRADRGAVLTFAPLQGPTAARLAEKHDFPLDVKTMIYVRHFGLKHERVYVRSDGVLRALGDVGGVWWLLSGLRIVPRFVRDPLYDWVARNRYRWFGKYDSCPLPSPDQRARFLP